MSFIKDAITCERDVINFDTPNRDRSLANAGNFTSANVLGRGSYGTVIRGVYKSEAVAVKILDIEKYHNCNSFVNETNILDMEHENIIRIIKVIKTVKHGLIIMQRFNGQSLQFIIDRHVLVLQHRLWILLDVLNALNFCHQHGILHLDVKPQNILVAYIDCKANIVTSDHNYICKLCDFGCSAKIEDVFSNKTQQYRGTIRYMAPEILSSYLITASADIYSLGISMWQLRTSRFPYEHISSNDVVIYGVVRNNLRPDSAMHLNGDVPALIRNKENLNIHADCCKSSNEKTKRPNILKLQNSTNFKRVIPKIQISHVEYEFKKSSTLDVFALSPRNNFQRPRNSKMGKGSSFVRHLNFQDSLSQELSSLCQSAEISVSEAQCSDCPSEIISIFSNKTNAQENSKKLIKLEDQYVNLYRQCWHSEPQKRPTIPDLLKSVNQLLLGDVQ